MTYQASKEAQAATVASLRLAALHIPVVPGVAAVGPSGALIHVALVEADALCAHCVCVCTCSFCMHVKRMRLCVPLVVCELEDKCAASL